MTFYAGMIPFYLDACTCIPDVMGSEDWQSPYGVGLLFEPGGGGYYWAGSTSPQPMFWPDMDSGYQSIKMTVTNWGPLEDGGDIINLTCRSTDTSDDESGINFWIRKWVDSVDGPTWDWFIDADGAILDVNPAFAPWPFAETVTIRLESDVDGAYRAYVADTLISSGVDPTQDSGATSVGFWVERFAAGDETTTAHMSDICIKVCVGELV